MPVPETPAGTNGCSDPSPPDRPGHSTGCHPWRASIQAHQGASQGSTSPGGIPVAGPAGTSGRRSPATIQRRALRRSSADRQTSNNFHANGRRRVVHRTGATGPRAHERTTLTVVVPFRPTVHNVLTVLSTELGVDQGLCGGLRLTASPALLDIIYIIGVLGERLDHCLTGSMTTPTRSLAASRRCSNASRYAWAVGRPRRSESTSWTADSSRYSRSCSRDRSSSDTMVWPGGIWSESARRRAS